MESFGDFFPSDRKVLLGKELDLYNEDMAVAVEYCGLYWHNDKSLQIRDKHYHYNKYIDCLNKRIRLVTIFEDEWSSKKTQICAYLKSIIGKNTTRVYVRNCEVKSINPSMGNNFINSYHIEGVNQSDVFFFGLFLNNELLGVMSFEHELKEDTLSRLCFKSDVSVVGGPSKLFYSAVKELSLKKVVTLSDNRWSLGAVYLQMGFTLESEIPPSYSYVCAGSKKRVARNSIKKTQEAELGKIWDCGMRKWIWKCPTQH